MVSTEKSKLSTKNMKYDAHTNKNYRIETNEYKKNKITNTRNVIKNKYEKR